MNLSKTIDELSVLLERASNKDDCGDYPETVYIGDIDLKAVDKAVTALTALENLLEDIGNEETIVKLEGEPDAPATTIGTAGWRRPEDSMPKSYVWKCTACGQRAYFVHGARGNIKAYCGYRFCPWCGTRMSMGTLIGGTNDSD